MRAILSALSLAAFVAGCSASAEPEIESIDKITQTPVLAELFTSQGCSSCPPAEAYFEKLTERDDVAVIVWHVDVWDTLVHRGSSWKDPYSNPAFTKRLRNYNINIRNTPQIYTPQAIIGGETTVIGSRGGEIESALTNAKPRLTEVSFTDGEVALSGRGEGEVIFVRLLREHSTDVKGGENKGRQLSGKNIALEGLVLGEWTGEETSFALPEVGEDETCAVIVQAPKGGRVLGAGMCL